MDAFFKPFLRSDASRNPVLSGYFAAIVGSFVAKKQQEMLAYFFADAQIPDLFLARLDVSSILELLRLFLNQDSDDQFEIFEAEADKQASSQPFMSERSSIFSKIKQAYAQTRDLDVKMNIKQLFAAITKDVTPFAGAETYLFSVLFSEDFLEHLFADMVDRQPASDRLSPKTSADLAVDLLSVLNPHRKIGDSLMQQMNMYAAKKRVYEQVAGRLRKSAFEAADSSFEQVVVRGLQRISEYLERSPLQQAVNSIGAETRVMDSHHLSLFEVVLATVHLNSDAIDAAIVQLRLLPLMTVLSAQPVAHVFLHLELALPHALRQVRQADPRMPPVPQADLLRSLASPSCSTEPGSSSDSKSSTTKQRATSSPSSGTSASLTGSPRTSLRTSTKSQTSSRRVSLAYRS